MMNREQMIARLDNLSHQISIVTDERTVSSLANEHRALWRALNPGLKVSAAIGRLCEDAGLDVQFTEFVEDFANNSSVPTGANVFATTQEIEEVLNNAEGPHE